MSETLHSTVVSIMLGRLVPIKPSPSSKNSTLRPAVVKLSFDSGCVQSWAINRSPMTGGRIMASRRGRSLVCGGALDMLCELTRRLRSRHDDSYHGGTVDHRVGGLDWRKRHWLKDKRVSALKV